MRQLREGVDHWIKSFKSPLGLGSPHCLNHISLYYLFCFKIVSIFSNWLSEIILSIK